MSILLFTPKTRDGFKLSRNNPYYAEHELLNEYLDEIRPVVDTRGLFPRMTDTAAGARIAALEPPAAARIVNALRERLAALGPPRQLGADATRRHAHFAFEQVLRALLMRRLPLTDADLTALADWLLMEPPHWRLSPLLPYAAFVKAIEAHLSTAPLSPGLDRRLHTLEQRYGQSQDRESRKLMARLAAAAGRRPKLPLVPGEAWSDAVLADLAAAAPKAAEAWIDLLEHCGTANGAKPSAKWRARAAELVAAVGADAFKQALVARFPLVDKPRTQPILEWPQWSPDPNLLIDERNADVLKGLVWCCTAADGDIVDALTTLAMSGYRKVPGLGPRAIKIGNACIYALGEMPGDTALAALAVLKVRVKVAAAQKGIAKALDAAAARAGITRDELEEIGVPTYGFQSVGERHEACGDGYVQLRVGAAGKVALGWLDAAGKRHKTIPKAIAGSHAEAIKSLKRAAKDAEKMLAAQRDRLDGLFLARRSWRLRDWRQRYLDHPLIGTLARRLIWDFAADGRQASGCWWDEGIVDANEQPIAWLADDTEVRLWHPALDTTAAVVEWREWIERHEVQQPFKQAHREIYLLTDAERATGVYSNRFAAHVLKQHQFNALCAARGWHNKLRLMVDDEYPPAMRELPGWGVRAEFWIEGAGNEYGTDTSPSGAFLYLTTDQVRFYRADAPVNAAHAGGGGYYTRGRQENAPLELADVPPIVLSEILRDVDLFVGVSSVGNDPTWSDGGPQGRYRDYWNHYSFGLLTESAVNRRAVLERLLPRLKIRDRCTLVDRFLVVRGDLRTYKIHLGSANVLMEPNDQYLCIVPAQSPRTAEAVFLPFEGDTRLAVILSKAFLLAADTKIDDPSIARQIASA